MTRRRRRNSRKRKCSSSKERSSLPIQPDCQNGNIEKVEDETSMNSARKNKAAPPESGVTLSSEESSDDDSRENCQGAFKSKMQQNVSDYKVYTAKDKIIFQTLIKQASAEIITVTIERSRLDPEIMESSRITLQHQQPAQKAKTDNTEQGLSAKVKCNLSSVEVEIKNISFSGDGATFVIGNKGSVLDEEDWSTRQRHGLLLPCSAPLNNGIHVKRQADRNSWLKLNTTTNDTDVSVPGKNNFSYRDNISIYKQNFNGNSPHEKKHNNDKILYSSGSPESKGLSDFSFHSEEHASSQSQDTECFLNIPPPEDFAGDCEDIEPFTMNPEGKRSIQSNHGSESDNSPITSAGSEGHHSSDLNEMMESSPSNSRSESFNTDSRQDSTVGIWTHLSECDLRFQASEELPASRGTSPTKGEFGKREKKFRIKSMDDINSPSTQSDYQKRLGVRRKTYPEVDTINVAFQMEWKEIPNLLYQGQQYSSFTPLPPFFIQTLPRKQGKPERVSVEDVKSCMCFKEHNSQGREQCRDFHDWSRINHLSSSGTLSLRKSPATSPSMLANDNPGSFTFEPEESIDNVFCLDPSSQSEFSGNSDIFRTDLCSHQNIFSEEGMNIFPNKDIDSWQADEPQEQGDFTESGFDEETLDSDYRSELAEDTALTTEQFQIQVTPSSPNSTSGYVTSQEYNLTAELAGGLDTISELDDSVAKTTAGKNTEFKERRQSVTTLLTGVLDQRLIIHNNSRMAGNADVSQHCSAFGEFNEEGALLSESNAAEMPNDELDCSPSDTVGYAHTFLAPKHLSHLSLTTMMDDLANADSSKSNDEGSNLPKDLHSEPTNAEFANEQNKQDNYMECCTDQNDNTQNRVEEQETVNRDVDGECKPMTANCPLEDTEQPSNARSSENQEEVEANCQKAECTEKQKWQQDLKAEASCLLQLPTDPMQKDGKANEGCKVIASTEGSDYWAKRRKQFKETKHCNSAGGNSVTSNQDSVNAEEACSGDLAQVRAESEQRGIYTETFNATSWIFRGDDVNSDNNPHRLGKRTRPTAIRERTVKIAKGSGDYPWGFRIHFSKPILVTEVDTNGAAEEAGLQIGDIVLTVNGTDVTSIPHSEASSLARQGPDILTLVVGSDISRCPNTPRPACRGYLHKRTQSGFLKGWRKRWFVLKHNGLFYYYKNKKDEGKCQPLDVMKLEGAEVAADTSLGKPFVFKCTLQSRSRMFYFCSTSNQEMKRWLEAMEQAVHPVHQNHVWVDVTHHNANLPPLAIKSPECLGLLHLEDRNKDIGSQHYCVLKDACLYFYAGIRSTHAQGGIYLQGYTVSEQSLGSKRTLIEAKPPSEEFKTFYLCADNAADNKRWIVALKASISKWLPLHKAIHYFMNNPPEQRRM
ncbi:uncharacterized protein pdzph1 [Scyliorhinus canicula]|uniref:uncharacterized protein pdzph1 n=1 Tax=Scyliorhinus canicula TaxID=7830 RepID=UPI0018F2F7D4|nr:uncharacterized protein pdzph1 [Scyliorhinus canicula]